MVIFKRIVKIIIFNNIRLCCLRKFRKINLYINGIYWNVENENYKDGMELI